MITTCKKLFLAVLATLAAGALSPEAVSQTMLHQWQGLPQPPVGDSFGHWMTGMGDLDGDGVPDVAIAAPQANGGGILGAGRIHYYSGRDGRSLRTITGSGPPWNIGTLLQCAGDVDRDGVADVLHSGTFIHADQGRRNTESAVMIHSGRTGQMLRLYPNGYSYPAAVGDVNGDGVPDYFVGNPLIDGFQIPHVGRADLFSGRDGAILYTYHGSYAYQAFGSTARAGEPKA